MLWLVQYYASGEAAWRAGHGDGQKRFAAGRCAWASRLERTRPEWFAEPAVCFPLAAAYRNQGQARQAERFYQVQGHRGDRDAWSVCAQSELRLSDPKGRPHQGHADMREGRRAGPTWTAGWTIRCGSGPSRPPCRVPSTTTAIGRPRSCWPTTPSFLYIGGALPAAAPAAPPGRPDARTTSSPPRRRSFGPRSDRVADRR